MPKGWSTEQIETLRKLWGDGLSAAAISRHMPSKTRNAVIGMARRMGLGGRPSPIKAPRTVAPGMSADELRERNRLRQAANRKQVRQDMPKATHGIGRTDEPVSPVIARPVRAVNPELVGKFTLDQVQEARGCLWGFGHVPEMTFCGKDRVDVLGNYCAGHQRIAYRSAAE